MCFLLVLFECIYVWVSVFINASHKVEIVLIYYIYFNIVPYK